MMFKICDNHKYSCEMLENMIRRRREPEKPLKRIYQNGNAWQSLWFRFSTLFVAMLSSSSSSYSSLLSCQIKWNDKRKRKKIIDKSKQWREKNKDALRMEPKLLSFVNPNKKAIPAQQMAHDALHKWYWWFLFSLFFFALSRFNGFCSLFPSHFLHYFIIVCEKGKLVTVAKILKLNALITFHLFDACATLTTTTMCKFCSHCCTCNRVGFINLLELAFFSFPLSSK